MVEARICFWDLLIRVNGRGGKASADHNNIKNTVIHNFLDLSIDEVDDYVCNGYSLTEQLKTYSYKIPGYKAVKHLDVRFKGSRVDDNAVLRINGVKLYDLALCCNNGWDKSKTVEWIMDSEDLIVEVGAWNRFTSVCWFNGGFSIKVRYD